MCTNVLGNLCVHRCAAVLSQDPMLCDMSAHVKNLGLEGGKHHFHLGQKCRSAALEQKKLFSFYNDFY